MENKNTIREKIKDLFINDIPELTKEEVNDLEIGIYNASLDYANMNKIVLNWDNPHFKDVYCNKARSIYSNLKTDSYIQNKTLIQQIKNNNILPHDIPNMKIEHMFPARWEEIMNKTRDKFKNAYEISNMVAMTNRFVCKKCKSRKITYYDQMTRSADEAITTFYQCQECGYKWKN